MDSFTPVWFHRLKYMLTPQLDLYQNINNFLDHGERILDFGCGNGFGTIQLLAANLDSFGRQLNRLSSGRCVHGVDIDENAIQFAKSILGHLVEFSLVSEMIPRDYDAVTCIEVIEHVNNVDKFMFDLKEIVPDGVFIFSTLNHNSQYRKNVGHVGKWCVKDFRWMMHEYFDYVRITDYMLRDSLSDNSTLTPMVAICRP